MEMTTGDVSDATRRLLQSLRMPGQPEPFYAVLKDVLQETAGFIFVTLFLVHRGETLRIFTTEDELYPTGVRKPMASTAWGDLVIGRQETFLATDLRGIRSAFFDHAKIESLGCGSAICVPIVYDGKCIGSLNLNHREHHYTKQHVGMIETFAPVLVPVLLDAVHRLDEA
ncbi:GAF domain-containing protein [Bradyrhizobium sp.]|uniref:GAF domain-containing protein n=1 Tax=Bradyrhizobium sp. TaxID=376 RepID=UPI004037CC15